MGKACSRPGQQDKVDLEGVMMKRAQSLVEKEDWSKDLDKNLRGNREMRG